MYSQHLSGILVHMPVGNSYTFTKNFSSARLPVQDVTYPNLLGSRYTLFLQAHDAREHVKRNGLHANFCRLHEHCGEVLKVILCSRDLLRI
jgi:hypothetical protein